MVDSLPIDIVKGGTFAVDPGESPLPAGMTLMPNGTLSVGAASVGQTDDVIFSYTEPESL